MLTAVYKNAALKEQQKPTKACLLFSATLFHKVLSS